MASDAPSALEIHSVLQQILLPLTFMGAQGGKEGSTISNSNEQIGAKGNGGINPGTL